MVAETESPAPGQCFRACWLAALAPGSPQGCHLQLLWQLNRSGVADHVHSHPRASDLPQRFIATAALQP